MGKAKNTRKRLCSNESSKIDKIQILLSDHSSDNFSDPCDVKKNLLVPDCTNEPAIGDYVLDKFKTFPRKYYVGRITKNKNLKAIMKFLTCGRNAMLQSFFLRSLIWFQ